MTQTSIHSVFEKAYSRLNPAQKEAADTIYGPVMVIAGPGTGKTQIVACRTANILAKTDTRPENILITTFTEAGVISIKKRLLEFLGPEAYKVEVSTIHSFCNNVLQMYPEKFLRFRAKKSLDDVEQIELFEEILLATKYEALSSDYDRLFYLQNIRDRIGKLKQEGISPEAFDTIIAETEWIYHRELEEIDPKLKKYENTKKSHETHIAKLRDLSSIYQEYLRISFERGYYDFADMISHVAEVLKVDNELRASLAERYQFIMLDEFQDMSSAQNSVVDAILSSSETPNVMTVGDDDQSIYRFQGANLENMFRFSSSYPDTKFIVLSENYRSISEVIELAKESIVKNESRITKFVPAITKELHSNYHPESRTLATTVYSQPLEEKADILEKIRSTLASGVNAEEIAVLVNTNREASEFAEFLNLNGVKATSKKEGNALESYFVRLLLDIFAVIQNPYISEERLLRVMRSGLFDIPNISVLRLNRVLYKTNFRRQDHLRIFDTLMRPEFLEDSGIPNADAFVAFATKIADLSPKTGLFYEDAKRIIDSLDYIAFVEKEGSFFDLEAVFSVLERIKEWNYSDPKITLERFLKKLEYYDTYGLILSAIKLGNPPDAVVILTAHQSKGLEYDTVFMPNLVEGNWGGRRVPDQLKLPKSVVSSAASEAIETEAEEETRRLFFVGMTRAKRQLFLSFPASDGAGKEKIASRYLTEISVKPEFFADTIDYVKIIAASERADIHFKSRMDEEEIAYIKEFLSTYKLSPSDLSKFLEDPKMFLRDTVFKYPFEDNEYTIFGKNYHKALEEFYLTWKKEGKIPTKESLLDSFMRSVSREFVSPDILATLKKKGEEWLSGWYDLHAEHHEVPLELEYSFSARGIVFEWIPLTGTIDKIELVSWDDGVRLVDYKTGRPKTLGEIKGETKNSDGKYFRQLLFYELMFSLDASLSGKYRIESLGIDFVEWKDGKYPFVEVERTAQDIENLKSEIRTAWRNITDMEYWKQIMQ